VAEMLVEAEQPIGPLGFLPDGRTLLVQRWGTPETQADIGVFTLGDTAIQWRIASEFREGHGAVSPDGRWLAYVSNRSGAAEVYIEALSGRGGRVQVSVDGGHSPRWSPDGSRLYYRGGPTTPALIAADLEYGARVLVTSREVVFRGPVDLNRGNINYDIDRTTGRLLLIVFGAGGEDRQEIRWILDWPAIVQEMVTGR
jgi:dipeptidyl aminopeptidase/acylaminoacyl peptidase